MYLYYAIGFSGMGVLWLLSYYTSGGGNTVSLILGILSIALGSYNGRKHMENKDQ